MKELEELLASDPWQQAIDSGLVEEVQSNRVDPGETLDYIGTVAVQYGNTSVEVFNLTFTSDWENYGIALPSASEGVQMAVGAEYQTVTRLRAMKSYHFSLLKPASSTAWVTPLAHGPMMP